jgi:hypothetical protein
LLLAAEPDGSDAFTLACARIAGPWTDFGHITLDAASGSGIDTAESTGPAFDPVLNQIPGLSYYPWAARLREGSYRAARRSRGKDLNGSPSE